MTRISKYIKYFNICIVFFLILTFQKNVTAIPVPKYIQVEIDSLIKILPLSEPFQRVDILVALSKHYLSFSMDSSWEYASKALIDAKKLKDKSALAETYKLLGNICYYQGNYNNVIHFYDSSAMAYEQVGDSLGLSKVWNNLGIIYQNIGNYDKSIDYHYRSLDCKINLKDSLGIANSYNNIGSIYYDMEDLSKAHKYFVKALEISEKLNNPNAIQSNLNNLGLINQESGKIEESLEYFERSLQTSEKTNNQNSIANTYHNIGKSKFLLGEYNSALEYYFRSLDIYNNIGVKNSQTLNNIGQIYIELDYYKQALKYLNQALKIAKENNQFKYLRDIYKNLSVVYARMRQFDKAYDNYLNYNYYDDSINNQIYSNNLEKINTKYENEKKKEEIELLNLENQLILEKKDSEIRRRNYTIYSFIAGFITILIISIILWRLFRQKAKSNTLLQQQNEEIVRSDKIIKKINKALSENEEMLRSVFDASPYSILVMDSKTTIIDCNNASLSMFNTQNKRAILNKKIEDLIIAENSDEIIDTLGKTGSKKQLNKLECTLRRNDESTFNAEITSRLIKDSTGKSKAYILIITDITERLSFISSLKDAKKEAEESDRLKTAFLANMSHEIRTPMNSIVGFSNLLNEPDIQSEKKDEYLQHILYSSNTLLKLIDDIIDISKIEAGQLNINMVKCKINPLLIEVLDSFRETNKDSKVELRLNLPSDSDLLYFRTDLLRIRQILSNLIGNALKFTEKGNIEIGYRIDESKSKTYIEFYVKDTGIGIPKNKQKLIFDRFRQIDESRTRRFGGTGLGLSISKRLVEVLGGSIWVESESKKGSTFYFALPLENGIEKDSNVVEQFQSGKFNWKGKTILIAEDENSNFELIKATINKTKIKIVRASNGEEAVSAVKNNNVDIVLMDIRMPVMNGYDATRQIKSTYPKLPIISITAYAMSEDESKSLDAGCDKYISKPIRPGKLLEVIDEFL